MNVAVLIGWLCVVPLLGFAQRDSVLGAPIRTVRVPDAQAMAVDQEGNLLLLSSTQSRVCKLLARFDYDSTYCAGGPGATGEGFNRPTSIQLMNRQELFVLDPNSRRLVLLNVDLRWLREIDFEETPLRTQETEPPQYISPKAFAVGSTGELYVLNAEDNAVYKFDVYGRFERRFGGLNYGEGQLVRANELVVTSDQVVYVSDTAQQRVSVFDKFGVYQYALEPKLGFRWSGLRGLGADLLFFGQTRVAGYDLARQRALVLKVPVGLQLRDVQWRSGALYLLGEGSVSLYRFP
jgi:hypothetical protein